MLKCSWYKWISVFLVHHFDHSSFRTPFVIWFIHTITFMFIHIVSLTSLLTSSMNLFLNVQVKGVYNERRVVIERRPGVDLCTSSFSKTISIIYKHVPVQHIDYLLDTLNMVRTQETNHNCQKHVISDHSIRSNIWYSDNPPPVIVWLLISE